MALSEDVACRTIAGVRDRDLDDVGLRAAAHTVVDVEAIGLPGATVSYAGESTTLDADGHATFIVPDLHLEDAFFAPWLIDSAGQRAVFHVERDGAAADITPSCIPTGPSAAIDRVRLLFRREIASGACEGIALELQFGAQTTMAEYTPERFDDQPCGPWQSQ